MGEQLPDVDAFMGLAQMGLGLAGFSGIALALASPTFRFGPQDRALVSFVPVNCLTAAGLAVLPVMASLLRASPSVIWRTCSAFHFALAFAGLLGSMFGRRSLISPPLLLWSMRAGLFLVLILQLLNATGWLFGPSGGVYFLAVFLVLPGTAFVFGRLLFQFIRDRET